MDFTIANMQDLERNLELSFGQSGDSYTVGIMNENTKEYNHKAFAEMKDAYKVYEKLSKAIIEGSYNYQGFKEVLYK